MRTRFAAIALAAGMVLTGSARAEVFNFDLQDVGHATYALGNGVFSTSPAATYWNSLTPAAPPATILNEFGGLTSLSILSTEPVASGSGDGVPNALTDSGWGEGQFELRGLDPFRYYDVAGYLNGFGHASVDVLNGSRSLNVNNLGTGAVPGVLGADYALLKSVRPRELAPGVHGLRFGGFDGELLGVQVREAVGNVLPDPGAATMWEASVKGEANDLLGDTFNALSAGHNKTTTNTAMPTSPPTTARSEASAGLNLFGGGSAGVLSEVRQVGERGVAVPEGGHVTTKARFVSRFIPVADDAGDIDVDIRMNLDGALEVFGINPMGDPTQGSASIEILAKAWSTHQPAQTLFQGRLFFNGNDLDIVQEGDMGNLGLESEMIFVPFFRAGDPAGGRLLVDYIADFDDVYIAMPGEELALEFLLTASARISDLVGQDVEYALSDFLHTLGGSVSSDTPGVTFVSVVPEPSSAALLMAIGGLALRRRRRC